MFPIIWEGIASDSITTKLSKTEWTCDWTRDLGWRSCGPLSTNVEYARAGHLIMMMNTLKKFLLSFIYCI